MYLDAALPAPAYFSAVEAGRYVPGTTDEARMREAMHMKGQGVKNGVADLFVVYLGETVWIELKVGRNTQRPEQIAFQRAMEANYLPYAVIRSVEALHGYLCDVGIPIPASFLAAALHHDAELAAEPTKKRQAPSRPRARKTTLAQIARFESIRK